MSSHGILHGYEAASKDLIERFERISSAKLLEPVLHLLPVRPANILDIGAGTGRDAAWLADRGHHVVAVEPVDAFRRAGRERHGSSRIEWIDDALPDLSHVVPRFDPFDLILANAVWQHLDADARRRALPEFRTLLAPGGVMIVSIRHGPGAATRPVFPANVSATEAWAEKAGFARILRTSAGSIQDANRNTGTTWTWLGLQAT